MQRTGAGLEERRRIKVADTEVRQVRNDGRRLAKSELGRKLEPIGGIRNRGRHSPLHVQVTDQGATVSPKLKCVPDNGCLRGCGQVFWRFCRRGMQRAAAKPPGEARSTLSADIDVGGTAVEVHEARGDRSRAACEQSPHQLAALACPRQPRWFPHLAERTRHKGRRRSTCHMLLRVEWGNRAVSLFLRLRARLPCGRRRRRSFGYVVRADGRCLRSVREREFFPTDPRLGERYVRRAEIGR